MMHLRGQYLVALIFAVAVAMSGYAWWSAYQRGRLSLATWGSEAALQIRYADRVELWQLAPPGTVEKNPNTLTIEGQLYAITKKSDISQVPGLVHARHALVEDTSFVWQPSAGGEGEPRWQFALHFTDSEHTSTIVFDTELGQIRLLDSERSAKLQPELIGVFAERSRRWANGGVMP
jgi:hypothetical protein